jgi:hypothetical protein
MKKLVVMTMVMALFIGIPVCVFAQEEPRSAPWCNRYAAAYPDDFAAYFKNLGECVSYIQACSTPKDDPALCTCRWMRMVNPQRYEDRFGTQGLGPCVSSLRTATSH